MSKTTKRKHVTKEALTEYYIPEGDEQIVRILGGRGNNLHEVEAADGTQFLVSMPTKFRKNLWVKRGDFVVVNPIKEGNKVLAEIIYVLYAKQIKYLQDEELWPDRFIENKGDMEKYLKESESNNKSDSSTNGDELLFENPNRKHFLHAENSESSSSEDEEYDEVEEKSNNEENKL